MHQDQTHFASCSQDKTIKIWSANSIQENVLPAALSKDTFRYCKDLFFN